MEKSQIETPVNAIEAWKSHLALSSGSERSDGASSRGSSSICGPEHGAGGARQRQPWMRPIPSGKPEDTTEDGPDSRETDEEDEDSDSKEDDDEAGSSDSGSEESEESVHEKEEHQLSELSITSNPLVFPSAEFRDNNISPSPKMLPDDEAEAMIHLLEIQEQEDTLYSPRPQRKYRPTVTSAYEPNPLPLYDHSHLAPAQIPPQYLYQYAHQRPPWHHHAPNHHPQPMHPQGYQASMQYPEVPEPPSPSHMPSRTKQRSTKLAGHEYIASKLTVPLTQKQESGLDGARPFPLYRRFEELNHRILLHLQEEISELEKDLHDVDEGMLEMSTAISMAGQHAPGSAPPNLDSTFRYGDPHRAEELRYRRTELLGRIFVKLGQYSE
jgi:hypothetical protein